MGLDIHLLPGLPDPALGIDQIADPVRMSLVRVTGGVIRQANGAIRVGEQEEGKRKLLRKRGVLLEGVKADAQNDDISILKTLDSVPEPFSLDRSPGGVGLWIEPQNHVLPGEVGQVHLVSGMGLGRELGGLFADR